jgi:nitrate reductase alpha subunit
LIKTLMTMVIVINGLNWSTTDRSPLVLGYPVQPWYYALSPIRGVSILTLLLICSLCVVYRADFVWMENPRSRHGIEEISSTNHIAEIDHFSSNQNAGPRHVRTVTFFYSHTKSALTSRLTTG